MSKYDNHINAVRTCMRTRAQASKELLLNTSKSTLTHQAFAHYYFCETLNVGSTLVNTRVL